MKSAKSKPCKSFSGISTTATRRAALLVFLTWQGYDLNAHLEPRAVQCYPYRTLRVCAFADYRTKFLNTQILNLAILKVPSFSGWHLCVAGPCVLVN